MKNEILRELKQCIYDLRDDSGNWRDEPIGVIMRAKTPVENIVVLKDILSAIINSDNISMDTKIFINNRLANIKDSNTILNEMIDQANESGHTKLPHRSYNSTVVRIANDNEMLTMALGRETLKSLIYNNVKSIKELKKNIDVFIEQYGTSDNSRNNLDIKIRNDLIKRDYPEGSDAFFERLQDLEMYLVQRKKIVEDAINNDEDFVGYFNYLLNSSAINHDNSNRDRERLLKYLNNQDYMTGYIEEKSEEQEEDSTNNIEDSIDTFEVDTNSTNSETADNTDSAVLDNNDSGEDSDSGEEDDSAYIEL